MGKVPAYKAQLAARRRSHRPERAGPANRPGKDRQQCPARDLHTAQNTNSRTLSSRLRLPGAQAPVYSTDAKQIQTADPCLRTHPRETRRAQCRKFPSDAAESLHPAADTVTAHIGA